MCRCFQDNGTEWKQHLDEESGVLCSLSCTFNLPSYFLSHSFLTCQTGYWNGWFSKVMSISNVAWSWDWKRVRNQTLGNMILLYIILFSSCRTYVLSCSFLISWCMLWEYTTHLVSGKALFSLISHWTHLHDSKRSNYIYNDCIMLDSTPIQLFSSKLFYSK